MIHDSLHESGLRRISAKKLEFNSFVMVKNSMVEFLILVSAAAVGNVISYLVINYKVSLKIKKR